MALNPYDFWRARNTRVAMSAYPFATCLAIFSQIEATFLLPNKLIISYFFNQKATYTTLLRHKQVDRKLFFQLKSDVHYTFTPQTSWL